MSETALLLAGFVLAHASWSISDTPELLVPLAVVQTNGERQLMRFEADTQEEAITHGKAKMASLGSSVDAWALAREGMFNENGQKVDVILVDPGGKGVEHRVTLIQRFEPYSKRHHFRLIGEPELIIDGHWQDSAKVKDDLATVRRGILEHPKVAPLWTDWHKP